MSNAHLYDRILRILKIAAELGEHRKQEVDEALGRSQGYFRRILAREAPLRVADLLRLIEILEIPWQEFFGPLVLGRDREATGASRDDLLLRLSRLLNAPEGPPPASGAAAEKPSPPRRGRHRSHGTPRGHGPAQGARPPQGRELKADLLYDPPLPGGSTP